MTSKFAPVSVLSLCMALGFVGASAALTPLSDDDLSDVRGGFVTVDGLTFGLGITVTTAVNGQQVLQNTLTLPDAQTKSATTPTVVTTSTGVTTSTVVTTSTGVTTSTVVTTSTGVTTPTLVTTSTGVTTPTLVTTSTGVTTPTVATTSTGVTTPSTKNASSTATAPTTDAPPFLVSNNGGQSMAVSPDGRTVVIQNINPAQLTNMVINSANNQSIKQDIQVNIVLPGFSAAQQNHVLSAIGMHLNTDGGIAIVGALSH